VKKIAASFLSNPYGSYQLFFNSNNSSRGVGILINKKLDFSVEAIERDEEQNILGLVISVEGKMLLLMAVYGPNKVCPLFFENLDRILSKYSALPCIIGGDWNLTPSSLPANINPDVLNMSAIPNEKHSKLLISLQLKFSLVDPFRILHPNRKDFSYVPRDTTKKNRSRIDFFLISKHWLNVLTKCQINQSVQNKLFDHRAVTVDFTTPKKYCKSDFISGDMIDNPLTVFVVEFSCIECYLHHAANIDNTFKEDTLHKIGLGKRYLREAARLESSSFSGPLSQENVHLLDSFYAELNMLNDDLNLFNFENLQISIDYDDFLEVLIMCIRNDVLSLQRYLSLSRSLAKKNLSLALDSLKTNYDANQEEIFATESQLTKIFDFEMRAEVEKFKHYELLNSEKITPEFVKLAKSLNTDYSLEDICDDDGTPFYSNAARKDHITKFFAKIYKKPKCESNRPNGSIEKFLGPEIIESSLVKNSKLSEAEKNALEAPLLISELDKAVTEANKKSAPGLDGLPMSFIAKFWHRLRLPLFRYSEVCFNKGILTPTFRSACVRLIPKKGNKKLLKNWRPISLLSNLYKVLSRALNNRLKTTIDRILGRAQKGFTSSRNIQEVLINVYEAIGFAKKNNLCGALISVDMAKAFDTVSHVYLEECYNFFNFGPIFINMLKTVGNSRTACIVMDDGTLSPNFKLESGRPQGEILSPVQYNIGNHILLLRIELDPGIKSLFNKILGPNTPFVIPVNNLDDNKFFRFESERETDKAEGFADDGNIITLADQESISCVEKILIDFASVSGLECNFEKSSIMYFGSVSTPEIATNFPMQKSVNLLGFDIDSEAASLQSNFLKVKKRLVAIANFWDRFSLSLPGRIQIAKTFMLSQVNYFGSIILPDPENLKWMQSLIDNFCLKNLNVSKKKLYLHPSSGGLGLIKLSDTLHAQQTIWFKKASLSTRDNWRWDLWKFGAGNCFTVPPLDNFEHPILSTLTDSFRSFLKKFYLKDANILEAFLLNNPLITLENGFHYDLNIRFWTASGNPNIFSISQLKIKHFYSEGKIKSLQSLNTEYNTNLPLATYFRLTGILQQIRNRFIINLLPSSKATDIRCFFARFKRGSKQCRAILSSAEDDTVLRELTTAFNNITLTATDVTNFKEILPVWNFFSFPNTFREFLFKFFHNRLPVNNRLANYADVAKSCTFCSIIGRDLGPVDNETFIHLFLECPTTKKIHEDVEKTLFDLEPDRTKKRWLGTGNVDFFSKIFFLTVQFFIWESKSRCQLPDANWCVGESIYLIDTAMKRNKKIKNCFLLLKSPISRLWARFCRPRW
jgi:exonuclease III